MRILPLALLALGLTSAPTSALAQEGFTEHVYADVFRLSAPADWDVRRDVKASVRLIALAPLDGADDPFQENLNVTVQDVPEEASLEAYYDDVFAGLATNIPGFEEVETRNVRLGDVSAKRLVYTYTFNEQPFRVITYVLLEGGEGYFLTGTALAATFDAYTETFEEIAGTFELE